MSTVEFAAEICRGLGRILTAVDEVQITNLAAAMNKASRIFVLGKGRSGLAMRMFAMRLMHLGVTVYVVGETTTPSIAATDLLIVGSGSGRTSTCCALAKTARENGATVALITAEPKSSPISEWAQFKVVLPAYESGVELNQFGGSFFEQALLISCDAVVETLRKQGDVTLGSMQARHANLE